MNYTNQFNARGVVDRNQTNKPVNAKVSWIPEQLAMFEGKGWRNKEGWLAEL